MLAGFAGLEALQGDIDRIRAALQLSAAPGDESGIGAHSHPGCLMIHLLWKSHDTVAVWFGVDFVAHLDEQGDVLVRAETRIERNSASTGSKLAALSASKRLKRC